jgi:hypothetical protein
MYLCLCITPCSLSEWVLRATWKISVVHSDRTNRSYLNPCVYVKREKCSLKYTTPDNKPGETCIDSYRRWTVRSLLVLDSPNVKCDSGRGVRWCQLYANYALSSIPVCEKYRRWAGRRILAWISSENFTRKLGPWWISSENLALGPQTKFRQHFHSLHGRNATVSKTTFLILSYPDKSQDHFETRHVIDPSVTSSMNWVREFYPPISNFIFVDVKEIEQFWRHQDVRSVVPFLNLFVLENRDFYWPRPMDKDSPTTPCSAYVGWNSLFIMSLSLSLSHTHTHTQTHTHSGTPYYEWVCVLKIWGSSESDECRVCVCMFVFVFVCIECW